jgi:hypothetical protein
MFIFEIDFYVAEWHYLNFRGFMMLNAMDDHEKWWDKNVEGGGCGFFKVISQHFSGWTDENHGIPQSRYPFSNRLTFSMIPRIMN